MPYNLVDKRSVENLLSKTDCIVYVDSGSAWTKQINLDLKIFEPSNITNRWGPGRYYRPL